MNYYPILKKVLSTLRLIDSPNETMDDNILNAARWALNDASFSFSAYQPTPLRPVLESLKKKESKHFRIAEKLSTTLSMPSVSPPELEKYFQQFKDALSKSSDNQLLTTFEIWASSIAVNSKYNDLSLYDFIKTTIGIGACLQEGNGKLRLAGGSISGIQTYLYDIISKNAAKLLKGRSFYLQLLADSLLDELLSTEKGFDLSHCHVVYSSGGGFYVLIPDTEGVESKFQDFANTVSEKVYDRHKTNLFVGFALTDSFDTNSEVNLIWDALFTKLNNQKCQRLNSIPQLMEDFFKPVELGGTRDKDPITNEEFEKESDKVKLFDGTEVMVSTKQQIDLGRDLRNAKYWVVSKTKINGLKETIKDPLDKFHYLEVDLPKGDFSGKTILSINDTSKGFPFVFYGGNRFPVFQFDKPDANGKIIHYKGEIMPFDELIDGEGFTRLGILRMDVDGLGAIFSEKDKIKSNHYELNWTRYVAVSRSLDQFFKGYLNVLQSQYADSSVIIYSGGDDLFLVGHWSSIMALAQDIYLKFKAWSCGNLTISGGLQLLPNKFPVMQGARMTDKAEKDAKSHSFKINTEGSKVFEKNAITLFGVPLNWETEFKIVNDLQKDIYNLIKAEKLNRSFIGKINIHAEAQKAYQYKRTLTPKWRWVMAYDFARLFERTKDNTAKDFINEMKNASVTNREKGNTNIINSKYTFLTLLQLSARWTEFRLRADDKNNSEN